MKRLNNYGSLFNPEFDQVYKATVPVGGMIVYVNTAAPDGFVECDGASVLRAGKYADLFNVIGTTFGSADPTHFDLPDLSAWVPANCIGIIKY